MKVLFVSPVVPWPPDAGGRIRTSELLRAVQGDAEVDLLCMLAPGQSPQAVEPLRARCASVRAFDRTRAGPVMRWSAPKLERWFHSRDLEAALAAGIEGGVYDLVHIDEMFLARTVPPRPGVRVCVHHHKLDTVLYEQLPARNPLAKGFDQWKLRRLEAEAARLWDQHLVCSEVDAAILRARYPNLTVGVIESGFDPDRFTPSDEPRDADRILFLGSLGYGPNVDAATMLLRELLPRLRAARPQLGVDIVGSEPAPELVALIESTPGVELSADVDDVRPYLARAGALVVPLRIGGGTRLKIVEALGMETPVVSTFMGAQGLAFRDLEHLRLAGGPEALVAALLQVLGEPEAARDMARRGRQLALERYTWPSLGARLLEHWKRIAAGT